MPEMSASPSPLPQELPRGAELVIAARCAPLSCRSFAARYARGRPVVLCCPRHEEDALLSARIAHALRELRPSGLRVVRMWLSCCGIPELLERIQTEEGAAVPSVISTLSRGGRERGEGFPPPPLSGPFRPRDTPASFPEVSCQDTEPSSG